MKLTLINIALLTAFTAFSAIGLLYYRFDTTLSEYDSYLTAIGLWDGHRGAGLASPLHYGVWFSYGYVLLLYLWAGASWFDNFTGIAQLMNWVGYWSTLGCVPLTWIAVSTVYGSAVAWVATLLFLFSPVFLDIAGGSHQLVPATALFLLGAAVLWFQTDKLRLASWTLAGLLLGISLSIRFEVAFAFPLLVLAQGRDVPLGVLVRTAVWRLAPTAGALAAFFIARWLLLPAGRDAAGSFVAQYYSLSNIPRGVVVALLAPGLATACAGILWVIADRWKLRTEGWVPLLGPLAIIGTGALFWLPNPSPGRHFLFLTLGVSVVLGIVTRRLRWRLGLVAALIVLNQAGAAAVAPMVTSGSSTISSLARPWPVYFAATTDFSWRRRAQLKTYMAEALRFALCLRDDQRWREMVLLTDNLPMVADAFIDGPQKPTFRTAVTAADGTSFGQIQSGGRSLDLVFREGKDKRNMVAMAKMFPGMDIITDAQSERKTDHPIPAESLCGELRLVSEP